jgi:hypothetical protein
MCISLIGFCRLCAILGGAIFYKIPLSMTQPADDHADYKERDTD